MGKRQISDPPNLKKYGVPFYSVAWIPQHLIKSRQIQTADDSSDFDHNSVLSTEPESESATKAESEPVSVTGNYLLFTGGGGAGRSGIPNALVIAHFDIASNSLSSQAVRIFLLLPFCFSPDYAILMILIFVVKISKLEELDLVWIRIFFV